MRPEMLLALIIIGRALNQRFTELTGMTLAEWDELNCQRIMSDQDL